MSSGLLYPRYIRPQDIILGTSPSVPRPAPVTAVVPTPAAAVSAPVQPHHQTNGEVPSEAPTKKRTKARWTEEQKEAAKSVRAPAPTAAQLSPTSLQPTASADTPPAVDKPAKLKRAKLTPEERVSGPGNADEALRMRSTLGYAAPAVLAASPPPAGGFAFGFKPAEPAAPAQAVADSSSSDEEEQTIHITGARTPAAAPVAAPTAVPAEPSSSSSSSEEESSSSDEEEDETTAPAPAMAASPAGDGEYVPRRVYVGGMPYRFTEAEIREYWGYCGEIEGMDIMTFPDTGRFRGIAFITFATEEGYQAALAYDGEECEGQRVKVQRCKAPVSGRRPSAPAGVSPPPQTPVATTSFAPAYAAPPQQVAAEPKGQAPKTPGYHVAYVGNVAYEADDAALQKLFEPYNVTLVRLHTDKETGRPKGFAHVHFRDEASLDQALQLNGTYLMGRNIKVGYAQAKKNHT